MNAASPSAKGTLALLEAGAAIVGYYYFDFQLIETFFQQLLALFILLNILLSVPNALALLMGLARANRHYRLLHGLKIAAWVWRVFSVLLLFVLANFILDNWLHYQFDWLTHGLTGLAGVALLAYGIHDLVRFWKTNRRDFFSLIS